ncbi:MAG: cytochrome c maturation protein CcmE [Lysobacteraceae bacterium]
MNPTRKRRLWTVALTLLAAIAAAVMITLALQANRSYLVTPSQIHAGEAPKDAKFRLGGIVKEASLRRQEGSLDVDFIITDTLEDIPVRYTGVLPDLFREGQSVITEGRLDGDRFVADEVMAKHDETYRPVELEKALVEERRKRDAEQPATEDASDGEMTDGDAAQ